VATVDGDVLFDDVSFSYCRRAGAARDYFHALRFDDGAGRSSGSGKSTMLSLILRSTGRSQQGAGDGMDLLPAAARLPEPAGGGVQDNFLFDAPSPERGLLKRGTGRRSSGRRGCAL